jgi:hypothetical protein
MAVEFWKHPVAATAIRCFKSHALMVTAQQIVGSDTQIE